MVSSTDRTHVLLVHLILSQVYNLLLFLYIFRIFSVYVQSSRYL